MIIKRIIIDLKSMLRKNINWTKNIMNTFRFGLIGCGNLGESIIKSALLSGITENSLFISSPNTERIKYLTKEYQIKITSDNIDIIDNSDVIMLCVKPFHIQEVCEQIKKHLKKDQIILSMAAGVQSIHLENWLDNHPNIIRCMPNIPISIGRGFVTVYKNGEINDQHKTCINQLFGPNRYIWTHDEKKIDISTVLTACGPGFIAYIANEFIKTGVDMGLTSVEAEFMIGNMIEGSGSLLLKTSPTKLMEQVASKGGATQRGINTIEQWGGDHIFDDMLKVAYNRITEIKDQINKNQIDKK